MPLFNKKTNKVNTNGSSMGQYGNNNSKGNMKSPVDKTLPSSTPNSVDQTNTDQTGNNKQNQQQPTVTKPQLVFHCQLAHGSPTGLITGFSSVRELYSKIAECYEFPVDEVNKPTKKKNKIQEKKIYFFLYFEKKKKLIGLKKIIIIRKK